MRIVWLATSLMKIYRMLACIRNRLATKPVTLKVYNIKFSFDIWLVLYMHFILYFWKSGKGEKLLLVTNRKGQWW